MSEGSSPWLDVSVPIHPELVHWPGDPAVQVRWRLRMERGGTCNLSVLSLSSHTGTHMDAPLHFLPGGKTLDCMPLDATVGPARVIEIKDSECVRVNELAGHKIRKGERLLFKTRCSRRSWKKKSFDEHFVYISKEAAAFLAQRRVRCIGIDYLSVGGFKRDSTETHQILLGAGIWIIEGLNLSKIKPGNYDLICLPLKILGSDGAPARAILRKGR